MKLKLWIIQDEKAWNELQKKGILTAKLEFIDPDFKDGYDWMKTQMNNRLGKPTFSNQYPIWAWYQAKDINHRKPDLRESGYLPKGTVGYRIEFEKEIENVLLSDFYLWDNSPLYHKVYIGNSESDELQFESALNKLGENITYNTLPIDLKNKVEKSWENIFDLHFTTEDFNFPFERKKIQATFWELKMSDVIKVDKFKSR